jgi:apolipoprotein N-acyltransferase
LIRLAPWLGEAGIAFVAALIGLAGAEVLATRRLPLRAPPRVAALLLAAAGLIAVGPAGEPTHSAWARTRLCSIQDPLRTGGNDAFGGAGDVAIFALAARAEQLGCELLAFPEYSLRLAPRQIVPADWGLERLGRDMIVIGGASIADGHGAARSLRNVVCRLHLGPGRQINCAGALDKLVFAPFGEAGLFEDVPMLADLGARISRQATGSKFSRLRSLQPVGLLPLGRGWRSGVAICWEILVPDIFEQRGVAGRGSVDLLAVPSDLDGFGGSAVAIDQLRRAASLHAISLGAPLLFASTYDPFLVTASGRIAEPVARERFVTVWEIALPAESGV